MSFTSRHGKACRRALWLGLWCSALAVTSRSAAQTGAEEATRAAARQLGEEGIQALFDGEIGSAEERLDRAYRLFATPTLGLWSARAHVRAEHLVEAAERYRETVHLSVEVGNVVAQRSAQQDAARELEALLPRVPGLTIELAPAAQKPSSLSLDGTALPPEILGVALPCNPGPHALVASVEHRRFEHAFSLAEGQKLVVPIVWPAEPAAATPPVLQRAAPSVAPRSAAARVEDSPWTALRPVGIAGMSAGAASLVASGITTWLARSRLDDCPKVKGAHTCSQDDDADAYERLRATSMVTFYAGLGLGAAGLTAFLLAPSPQTAVSWSVGPGAAHIRVRF